MCALLTDYSTQLGLSRLCPNTPSLTDSSTCAFFYFPCSISSVLPFAQRQTLCSSLTLLTNEYFKNHFNEQIIPSLLQFFWFWLHSELPLSRDICTNLPKLTSKVKWSHLKKWEDIAMLRVLLVTFTKYLLCSKFLSFSLHCWVFVTNYRIRHHCMYCMDKKGSKIQILFFKDIWACICWNKSHSQVHLPAWESTCLSGIFARFSIFLSLPFSLDSFSIPWAFST